MKSVRLNSWHSAGVLAVIVLTLMIDSIHGAPTDLNRIQDKGREPLLQQYENKNKVNEWDTVERVMDNLNNDEQKLALTNALRIAESVAVDANKSSQTNESDSLGLESEECKIPISPKLPLVRYAIVLDAGSSGTRVNVYKFNYCTSEQPMVETQASMKTKPGLSSFKDNPSGAAESLTQLLKFATEKVPSSLQSQTSITLKATAGLRKLEVSEANPILESVRQKIRSSPFQVSSNPLDIAEVMEGKDEGIYAWITVNYLLPTVLPTIHPESYVNKESETAATLELGGASTQIVFEHKSKNIPESYNSIVPLRGNDFNVYQHSYLNYGVNEAIETLNKFVSREQMVHPCYPSHAKDGKTFSGRLNAQECDKIIQTALFPEKPCKIQPCAFDGVFQTKIPENSEIFAFSAFYYALKPFSYLGRKDTDSVFEFTLTSMDEAQATACSEQFNDVRTETGDQLHDTIAKAYKEDAGLCAKLSYVRALLRKYQIDENRVIHVGNELGKYEMGWALGAALSLVNPEMKIPRTI